MRDGRKGKWFAAAQSAGHLDVALEFAHDSFAERATLIRVDRLSAKKVGDLARARDSPSGFVLGFHVACVSGLTTRQAMLNSASW